MLPGTRIDSPVEVALVQRDEVVSLLAALGAAVDVPINQPDQLFYTSQFGQSSMNLLQWTSTVVENLSKATPTQPQLAITQDLPTSPADDTWTQYRAFLTAVLPTKENIDLVASRGHYTPGNVVAPRLNDEHVPATRDYYARAESILRSYSTVPYQAPQSSEAPTDSPLSIQANLPPAHQLPFEQSHPAPLEARPYSSRPPSSVQIFGDPFQLQGYIAPQTSGYIRHVRNSFSEPPVPAHLKVLYDELYDACWTGDNAAIQELCLPKHLSDGKEPIQISVQTTSKGSFTSVNGMLQLTAYLRLSS